MKTKWKVIEKRIAFKNKWRRVDEWKVRHANGKTKKIYFSVNDPIVIIFAITDSNEVVLINQYYILHQKKMLCLPAGFVSKTPLESAKRELAEETGYAAKKWTKLGSCYIGRWQSDKVHFFLGEGCYKKQKQNLEDLEEIKVKLIPQKKFWQMVKNGKLNMDLFCSAGIYFAQKNFFKVY